MHTDASISLPTKALPTRSRLTQAVLAAVLVGAGFAHAADTPAPAVERALDPSPTREAQAEPDAPRALRDGRVDTRPYGSGYEARRLNASRGNAASAAGAASGATAGQGPGAGGGNRSGAGRHGRR